MTYLLQDTEFSQLTDQSLVETFQQTQNDHCFELLYDRYISVTYRKCLTYLEDENDAQDVLQNAWIAVYFALPEFRHEAKFSTWLYRITVNHCLNYLKANRHVFEDLEMVDEQMVGEQTTRIEEQLTLTILLDRLSAGERALLNLKFVEGFTYEEIAQSLSMTTSAVKMRVNRIRKQLQIQVDDD